VVATVTKVFMSQFDDVTAATAIEKLKIKENDNNNNNLMSLSSCFLMQREMIKNILRENLSQFIIILLSLLLLFLLAAQLITITSVR